MLDALITYIFISSLFLFFGIFPTALAYFIVKKIKKKNKIAVIIALLVAIIDILTYIILKLHIIDLLIYHFKLAQVSSPPLFVYFIVKSITNKKIPAIITSLFCFICICLYLYFHNQNVSNTIIILNYSDNNIYINKVYIGSKIIFQGKYILNPSDKNEFLFKNDALKLKYNIASNYHNLGVILYIKFNDGDIERKSSVQLIDKKKSGCIFYIYYEGNNKFSAICDSLYIDPAW